MCQPPSDREAPGACASRAWGRDRSGRSHSPLPPTGAPTPPRFRTTAQQLRFPARPTELADDPRPSAPPVPAPPRIRLAPTCGRCGDAGTSSERAAPASGMQVCATSAPGQVRVSQGCRWWLRGGLGYGSGRSIGGLSFSAEPRRKSWAGRPPWRVVVPPVGTRKSGVPVTLRWKLRGSRATPHTAS